LERHLQMAKARATALLQQRARLGDSTAARTVALDKDSMEEEDEATVLRNDLERLHQRRQHARRHHGRQRRRAEEDEREEDADNAEDRDYDNEKADRSRRGHSTNGEASVPSSSTTKTNAAVEEARFAEAAAAAQTDVRSKIKARTSVMGPGWSPPIHANADFVAGGAPPLPQGSPLSNPPTPNYFYPPTSFPPPAAVQAPRMQNAFINPQAFAPRFAQTNPYPVGGVNSNPFGPIPPNYMPPNPAPAPGMVPPGEFQPFEAVAPPQSIPMPQPAAGGGTNFPSLLQLYDMTKKEPQQQS